MSARMPRELADVSNEVRTVPPPPIPYVHAPLMIRVADPDGDAELISQWMNRRHLSRTWGYDRTPAEWHRHLSVQLAGTYSRPLVVLRDGTEYGYLEVFRAARDYLANVYDADPHDIGLHAAIADPAELDRGMARDVGPLIFQSLFAADPRCRRIVFDAEDHNRRALAVVERLGGVFVGDFAMTGNRQIALYALPRTVGDIPRPRAPSTR